MFKINKVKSAKGGYGKMPASKIKNKKAKARVKSKNAKNRKKSISQKIKSHKMGFWIMASLAVMLSLVSMNLLNNRLKIQAKDEEINALRQEYNHRRIKNDALEQKVDAPIDDEYVIEVARENGYRKSDEILFYVNSGE